ncbi:MAG: glycosyltransferase family 9 protein [Betaproteobacteria bacterium]|nr:glycosyltransferase family 9 protein [Betaproteobacteria bacterium]
MDIPFADLLLARYATRRAHAAGGVATLATLEIANVSRILLVLTTGLGDAVLSSPVFPAMRAALPRADIRLFIRKSWAGLFSADPDLSGVIPYYGKYRRFFATLASLRDFSPQLAVILHGNDPDIIPMALLAGSRWIVRVPTQGTRYTQLLSNRDRQADERTVAGWHYVENRLRVLDTLGVARTTVTPRMVLSPGLRARVARQVAARIGGRRYWAYHAFAADPYKVWPTSKARSFLGQALADFPDHALVLTGSGGDRDTLSKFTAGLDADRVLVLAGEQSIEEAAATLAGAACLVAPDTGVLHLAAALGTPVVGLYAPTFAALVGPRRAGARAVVIQKPQTCVPCVEKKCPYVPDNCMRQIAVEEVLAALGTALREAK